MEFNIVSMTQEAAEEIATWHYPTPYAIYDMSSKEIPILKTPSNRYFTVLDESESLIGYCCFGGEAQVMGGEYSELGQSVLDVGVGMHPEKVGQGLGNSFVGTILTFASKRYKPEKFRVTVAKFNNRSLRTFQSLGFEETHRFRRAGDGREFIQLDLAEQFTRNQT